MNRYKVEGLKKIRKKTVKVNPQYYSVLRKSSGYNLQTDSFNDIIEGEESVSVRNKVNRHRQRVYKLILAVLAGVLILAPFFRALFFDNDVLYFTFGIGLISALVLDLRFRQKENFDVMDWSIIGLAVWYAVTVPFAVSKGDAVLGTIRIFSYALLYFSASRLLTSQISYKGAWLLALMGGVVTLAGIGSSIGFPPVNGSWGSDLCSVFQYHNAFGAYLLMVFPITIFLYLKTENGWLRYPALAALYLNLLGLAASRSRGSYVIFLVILLLTVLALTRKEISLAVLIAAAIWAAVDDWTQVFAAGNAKTLTVLIWPFAGLLVLWLLEWVLHGARNYKPGRLLRAAGIALILFGLLIGTVPVIQQKYDDISVVAKAESIDFADHNWQERLAFYKDAIKMGYERPIFGFGAGGWKSAYKRFQSYLYYSKETHSQPLKILVEAGFPGLFLYSLFCLAFLWRWLKGWRLRKGSGEYLVGVAVIGVLLHSLMDFDLSESAVFYTLLLVLAGWRSLREPQAQEIARETIDGENTTEATRVYSSWGKRAVLLVLAMMTGTLIIASPLLAAGLSYAQLGSQALNSGQLDKALDYDVMALKYNSFQANVYAELAQLEAGPGAVMKNDKLIAQALSDLRKSLALNSSDPLFRSIAAKVYSTVGEPQSAFAQAQMNLDLAKLYAGSYEETAFYGLRYAIYLINQGKRPEALPVLNYVRNLPVMIESTVGKISKKDWELWPQDSRLAVTPRLKLYVGESLALLGKRTEAIQMLNVVSGEDSIKAETLVLKGILEKSMGDPQGEKDLNNALRIDPKIGASVKPMEDVLKKAGTNG